MEREAKDNAIAAQKGLKPYTLLNVDRGVPEVWGSVFDIRALLDATVKLRDGKKATDMKMNLAQELVVKKLLGKIKDTDIEKILKEYNVI